MKVVFKMVGVVGAIVPARLATAQVPAPAPPRAPAPDAPELVDLDGDGDIDDDDRRALEAAEVVQIRDRTAGEQLTDSSRAVTVIDLTKAHERSADLGEVLARTHGLHVRREGGLGSGTQVSLNGLSNDQIRMFLDGIPLAHAGWSGGIASVPVNMLDRVDVYRGVVPIALGADALGGAIDLRTDPAWSNSGSITYQVGSFGTHRASAGARVRDGDTGLALGLALFTDRAANDYPIDVEVADERGRLVPATVRRFHDGYLAGGAIVEGGVARRGIVERALVRVFRTQYDKELQHNAVMTIPYGEAAYGSVGAGSYLDLELAGGGWRGRLVAGGAYTTVDFRDLAMTVYDWYGRAVRDRPEPGELGDPTDRRLTERGLFARATLERALGAAHRVRIALAPTSDRRGGKDFTDPNPAGRDPIEAKRELLQLVVGVEHEWRPAGDRLENTAFAKLYRLAQDAEEVRPGFVFVPIADTVQRFGAGDSLRYRAAPGLALKASYELATRLPSADELFGDGILIQENLALEPERSHNLNLGAVIERETRWGTWTGDLAGFARLADGLIILIGNDRLFTYRNVYAARIAGVEGTGRWVAPGGHGSLEVNATVQDIRNASSQGTFGEFEGDRLPNRPWLLGSAAGSVRRRGLLRARDELSLFATSRYVRSFYRGWESLGLPQFKQVVPSQLVHGAGITYATHGARPVSITVEVSNLTDARAFDSFGAQRPGRALSLKLTGEL